VPGHDRVAFAATTRGLLKTEDQGRTWYRRGGGLPVLHIAGLGASADGSVVYVGEFSRGGLWKSADLGESWYPVPTSGLASDRVWALAVDPKDPGRVLAGVAVGGLHASQAGAGADGSVSAADRPEAGQ
jgi:photosystem II stability/assembly factor-like uncharacterized protein